MNNHKMISLAKTLVRRLGSPAIDELYEALLRALKTKTDPSLNTDLDDLVTYLTLLRTVDHTGAVQWTVPRSPAKVSR
jgi:hypothetical protein